MIYIIRKLKKKKVCTNQFVMAIFNLIVVSALPLQRCTTCSLERNILQRAVYSSNQEKGKKTEKVTLDIAGRLANNSAVLKDRDLYL